MSEKYRYRLVDQDCVDNILSCLSNDRERDMFLSRLVSLGLVVQGVSMRCLKSPRVQFSKEEFSEVILTFLDIVYSNMDLIQDMVRKLKFIECSEEEIAEKMKKFVEEADLLDEDEDDDDDDEP